MMTGCFLLSSDKRKKPKETPGTTCSALGDQTRQVKAKGFSEANHENKCEVCSQLGARDS